MSVLCAPDPGQPIRPLVIRWSEPGRRQYPHDSRTTVAETTGWQRHTMRATYRALRAAHQPWAARSAIVRLVNMGRAA